MNNNLIIKLNNLAVYYINDGTIGCYVSVPFNNNQKDIPISIEQMDSIKLNPMENDAIWIKDTITSIYKEIDQFSLCYVIPVYNIDQINIFNQNNEESIKLFDKIMSSIINSSYKLLVSNNLKVDNNVVLIDSNVNKNLVDWFINKYSSRIILKTKLDLLQAPKSNVENYQKIETPDMNFVVGEVPVEVPTNIPEPVVTEPSEPVTPTPIATPQEITPTQDQGQVIENKREIPEMEQNQGYISYYVLGLIAIILTLLVLYILI